MENHYSSITELKIFTQISAKDYYGISDLAKKIPVPNLVLDDWLINPRPDQMINMRLMVIPWMCYELEDGNYYENRRLQIAIEIADQDGGFYYP